MLIMVPIWKYRLNCIRKTKSKFKITRSPSVCWVQPSGFARCSLETPWIKVKYSCVQSLRCRRQNLSAAAQWLSLYEKSRKAGLETAELKLLILLIWIRFSWQRRLGSTSDASCRLKSTSVGRFDSLRAQAFGETNGDLVRTSGDLVETSGDLAKTSGDLEKQAGIWWKQVGIWWNKLRFGETKQRFEEIKQGFGENK